MGVKATFRVSVDYGGSAEVEASDGEDFVSLRTHNLGDEVSLDLTKKEARELAEALRKAAPYAKKDEEERR